MTPFNKEPIGIRNIVNLEEPAFILCGARSGSTLMRFIINAHPDFACPPELNIPPLIGQLSGLWSYVTGGAPLADFRNNTDELPILSTETINGVRKTINPIINEYLASQQKIRYCDKSLGTANLAPLLMQIYPKASLICLHRHPMDVVFSAIEACPWGLSGYGFDPYVSSTPGNSIVAALRYWIDYTISILTAEDRFPESVHRVRYEDLVTDPETAATKLFNFLGSQAIPGITHDCFSGKPDRNGPADYKIWHTSNIETTSLGRGEAIPIAQIPSPILDQVNSINQRIGYPPIDQEWGTPWSSGYSLPNSSNKTPHQPEKNQPETAREKEGIARLERQITTALPHVASSTYAREDTSPFGIIISLTASENSFIGWEINLEAGTVKRIPRESKIETEWDITGSPSTWISVLDGQTNIGVSLRKNDLRYCDAGESKIDSTNQRMEIIRNLLQPLTKK